MALVVGVAAAAIGVTVASYGLYVKLFRNKEPSEFREPDESAAKTKSDAYDEDPSVSSVNEVCTFLFI